MRDAVSALTRSERVWQRSHVRRRMRANPRLTIAVVVVASIVAIVVVNHYAGSSTMEAGVIVSYVMAQTARVLFKRRR